MSFGSALRRAAAGCPVSEPQGRFAFRWRIEIVGVRLVPMTAWGWVIFALWLTLVGYWCLSAYAVRHTLGRWKWWGEIAVRLGFFALVVASLQVAAHAPGTSMLMGIAGIVLCVLGIGLAMLGRAALGESWAVPTAHKAGGELVTRGPYAYVRHPIYSGMLLAMLGSAIGQSVLWLLPLFVYGPHFILNARREERLLLEQFPHHYPAYMKRTKLLLPFLL